jgi:hypothetical protein
MSTVNHGHIGCLGRYVLGTVIPALQLLIAGNR